MSKTGHTVDMVANGVEAVSAVVRVPYDLVLMDVQTPEMDSVTATRKIRDLPGDVGKIPIIALTANAMKGDREIYIEAGMTDYVSKPINPHMLCRAITIAAGQRSTDTPPEKEFKKPAAQNTGDEIGLECLMNDLDDLIKKA